MRPDQSVQENIQTILKPGIFLLLASSKYSLHLG